jgi:hypothetical protein
LAVKDRDYDGAIDSACKNYATGNPMLDCDDNNPRRYQGNKEICDGIDNDCDMVIDNNSVIDYDKSPPKLVVSASGARDRIVYSPGSEGELVVTYTASEAKKVSFALLSGSQTDEARTLSFDNTCGLTQSYQTTNHPECNLDEVATTAKVPNARITAAVNVEGCSDGQLRVGYIDSDTTPEFKASETEDADLTLSNTYAGIDVDLGRDRRTCSGASHPASPGAGRLSIANLEPEAQYRQALLVWLGDSINRKECGEPDKSVTVQALGLWLDADIHANKWVQASDDAIPRTLGQTVGGGRAALAVWPGAPADRGYFVGYGDQNGQVALHFVPRLPNYTTSNNIPKLNIVPAYKFSDNRADADHVAIAPANGSENTVRAVCGPGQTGLEIGVAWQEKCGKEEASVFFAVVGFVTSTETFCLQHDIIQIASGSAAEEGQLIPSVAYVGERFAEPGFARNGKPAATEQTGGWVVAWAGKQAGDNAIFARRIAEYDGQLLDKEEKIVLNQGLKGASGDPVLYPSKTGVKGLYFAFNQSDPNGINGFVGGALLSCEVK